MSRRTNGFKGIVMKIGLIFAVCLFAVGEALGPLIPLLSPVSQVGAVCVLAWWAGMQFRATARLRKTHSAVIDTICERANEWDKIRHDDSVALNETLREMVRHCAAAQGAFGAKTSPKGRDPG